MTWLESVGCGILFDGPTTPYKDRIGILPPALATLSTLEEILTFLGITWDGTLTYTGWTDFGEFRHIVTLRSTPEGILLFFYTDHLLENMVALLQEESAYDALTHCLRKNYGERRIEEMLLAYLRYDTTFFSLLMVDIDHFKKINDTYGHLAGDHILAVLAQRIKELLRESDIVIRFGGEEFVILLPMTKGVGALKSAQRLLEGISTTPFAIKNQSLTLTVSIGMTTPCKSDTLYALIERCDEALYKAKKNGRNQTVYV